MLKLKNVKVAEIMTPHIVIEKVDEMQTLNDFFENKDLLHFTRISTYSDREEHITDYVFLFENIAEGKDIRREVVTISDKEIVFNVWEMLLETKDKVPIFAKRY